MCSSQDLGLVRVRVQDVGLGCVRVVDLWLGVC